MTIIRARGRSSTHSRWMEPKTYSHGGNLSASDLEYAVEKCRERVGTFLTEEATAEGNPTSVYVYFGADDECLYVGITSNLVARSISHASASEWYQSAKRAVFEHYPNRPAALRRETYLITHLRPEYNRYRPQLFHEDDEMQGIWSSLQEMCQVPELPWPELPH